MNEILILYYSRYGATRAMAEEIARGVETVKDASAKVHTVPAIASVTEASAPFRLKAHFMQRWMTSKIARRLRWAALLVLAIWLRL